MPPLQKIAIGPLYINGETSVIYLLPEKWNSFERSISIKDMMMVHEPKRMRSKKVRKEENGNIKMEQKLNTERRYVFQTKI